MAIVVKDPNLALGGKVTYVTGNGVRFAMMRAAASFDRVGSGTAPAPRCKSLSIPSPDVRKGRGKFYGVETVKFALNPDHPVCHAVAHRATYYPADHVTFTAVSRKKPRPGSSAHGKTGHVGRGKVGVGGTRTRSHS